MVRLALFNFSDFALLFSFFEFWSKDVDLLLIVGLLFLVGFLDKACGGCSVSFLGRFYLFSGSPFWVGLFCNYCENGYALYFCSLVFFVFSPVYFSVYIIRFIFFVFCINFRFYLGLLAAWGQLEVRLFVGL
jgi:hypothetical protein